MEEPMNFSALRRRWAWPATALVAIALTLGALGSFSPGFGRTDTPLWTDRPVALAASTVPAPSWVELARAVKPAVVNVSATRPQESPRLRAPFPFMPDDPSDRPQRNARSLGSGFIINPGGYIVTNHHVVEGAGQVRVKLGDGRELPAKVVGRDSRTDLALLKVEATGLPVVALGDSAALQVGEPVMAVGNPFGLAQTVTTGIVSATGRAIGAGPYDDFIQTDASINPGNSGGPLVNTRGQVVGINAAIFSQSGGSVGIGFAIPVNLAKTVVSQLASAGRVERGWLGVSIQEMTPALAQGLGLEGGKGALVAQVTEGSPAARAGLQQGDLIVELDGRAVTRTEDLPRLVADLPVGRQVPIKLLREGKTLTLTATIARLEERDREVAAAKEDGGPALGVTVAPITPEAAQTLSLPAGTKGVVVRDVRTGSPAAEAGLQAGDVIVQADRRPITSVEDLREVVGKRAKDKPLLLLVRRDGNDRYVAVSS
jgi:serine protease Do